MRLGRIGVRRAGIDAWTRRVAITGTACALVVAVLVACGEDRPSTASPSGSSTIPQPSSAALRASGLAKFPFAPSGDRIDLEAPSFSNPTEITNPLNPVAEVSSAIVGGRVDGDPLRIEITLLPETRLIEWNGESVEALVSQFVAYRGVRMKEVALDFYAQSDDGDVWYFGEDVFNYADDGHIADMEGAWLAGRDGPAGIITPAEPRVGDAYRSENIPGLVFEESTVKAIGKTVDGPRGPVEGAFVIDEHHPDGPEIKKWAPGYGEFYTRDGRDFEKLALAVPIDSLPGPVPPELNRISRAAAGVFDPDAPLDPKRAAAAVERMRPQWSSFVDRETPPLLARQMNDALDSLHRAVRARQRTQSLVAAIGVGVASLDLQLRHRTPAEIDLARLDLQAALLEVDAEAGDPDAVRSDVANLDWIRDRIAHTLDEPALGRIDTRLVELIGAAGDEDFASAGETAARLRKHIATIAPAS
jgi:hypothetical protein